MLQEACHSCQVTYGRIVWAKVAERLPGRTDDQCSRAYVQLLRRKEGGGEAAGSDEVCAWARPGDGHGGQPELSPVCGLKGSGEGLAGPSVHFPRRLGKLQASSFVCFPHSQLCIPMHPHAACPSRPACRGCW